MLQFGLAALLPQSDMEDLYKLPYLIGHYQTAHSQLSWLDFLAEHYQSQAHEDKDHQKLPLKQHDHQGLQIFNIIFPLPLLWATCLSEVLQCHAFASPEARPQAIAQTFSPPPRQG
ncbi:MAG: hypothetical protein OHK0053_22400 [Microscillaceae bacterium]